MVIITNKSQLYSPLTTGPGRGGNGTEATRSAGSASTEYETTGVGTPSGTADPNLAFQ